jgi:hypothetical protein
MFCYMWWYRRKVLWGMDATYSNRNPRRVCVSSRFAIRGGTGWKSCGGWMRPNPKGTHRRVCVLPCFAIRGRSKLWICEARIRFIQKGWYLRLDVVHAAAWCMDTVSISERYCMWTLPWCVGTEGSFLQVHNSASLDFKWVPSNFLHHVLGVIRLVDINQSCSISNLVFARTTSWP